MNYGMIIGVVCLTVSVCALISWAIFMVSECWIKIKDDYMKESEEDLKKWWR